MADNLNENQPGRQPAGAAPEPVAGSSAEGPGAGLQPQAEVATLFDAFQPLEISNDDILLPIHTPYLEDTQDSEKSKLMNDQLNKICETVGIGFGGHLNINDASKNDKIESSKGKGSEKKKSKKRKMEDSSQKPVTISDFPCQIDISRDDSCHCYLNFWESSYPKISLVRERTNEKSREFFLNKSETNQLLDNLVNLQGLIEKRDMASKIFLSSKMNVSLSMIGSQLKVTFTTRTSSSKMFFYNFSLVEWEKVFMKLVDIRKKRDFLAENESQKKNFFPEIPTCQYIHELTYTILSNDLSENINCDEKLQTKFFLTMAKLFDYIEDHDICVQRISRHYVSIPKPSLISQVLVETLKKNNCNIDELTAKNLAIYLGQFYNSVQPGRFSSHELENACRYTLETQTDCHQAFTQELYKIIQSDYTFGYSVMENATEKPSKSPAA